MSDYTPNPGGPSNYDKYGNSNSPYDPPEPGGRGPYVLLAILVVIGLVGGLLYFNGTPQDGSDVARAPADRPATTAPATPGASPTAPGAPGAAPIDRTTPQAPATQQQ